MGKGWIRVDRKFLDHEFWKEDRPLSKAEAWLDIISLARYGHEPEKVLIGLTTVEVHRGQLLRTIRDFATRWKWSKSSVARFLDTLKQRDMIRIEGGTKAGQKRDKIGTGARIITVVKYEEYQSDHIDGGTDLGQDRDKSGTTAGQEWDYKKKERKSKKEKENPPTPLADEVELPSALRTKAFQAIWPEFVAHRREIRKPMTARAQRATLAKLAKYPSVAVQAVEESIANGWQGVFPEKLADDDDSGCQWEPVRPTAAEVEALLGSL